MTAMIEGFRALSHGGRPGAPDGRNARPLPLSRSTLIKCIRASRLTSDRYNHRWRDPPLIASTKRAQECLAIAEAMCDSECRGGYCD